MNHTGDTSPAMAELYRKMLMEKTNEERFLMGISMNDSVRRVVWSSLPDDLSESEKRRQFFLRYYENDFTEEQKRKILDWL